MRKSYTHYAIGKLGAIAVIRTALNFFLSREMQQERHESADGQQTVKPAQKEAGA